VPHVGLAGPPAGSGGREVRRDQGPLLVSDVAGVVLSPHPLSTSLGTLVGQSVRLIPHRRNAARPTPRHKARNGTGSRASPPRTGAKAVRTADTGRPVTGPRMQRGR